MAPAQRARLGEEGQGNGVTFRHQAERNTMDFGPTMKKAGETFLSQEIYFVPPMESRLSRK